VISTIRRDLILVDKQKNKFTSISELRQIDSLESKLAYFHQILPRLDSRRGIKDFGGTILKTRFGTATISDIHHLHEILDELQSKDADIVYSLSNQVTYIKQLDKITTVNSDATANLSTLVKDTMVQSHDEFQHVARDILWFNVTIHNQSKLYMIEFSLLLLVQQTDKLLASIQWVLLGKLQMTFINPTILHNILQNISLHLPEYYKLIVEMQLENIHLYYDMVKVAVVANVHCAKLVVNILLKTANQHFTLHKINCLAYACNIG